MVGRRPPTPEDNALVSEGLAVAVLDRTVLLSHLLATGGGRAYKELFEKMAEDVGIVRRMCEKV